MPRRPNTRPTNIYWLYDVRPETIALRGPLGWPFYCGKTVQTPEQRLKGHGYENKRHKLQRTYAMILQCGEHIRVDTMEVVPPEKSWVTREKSWIRTLRHINPDCTNVSDGGDGAPGNIHSDEWRALMSQKMKGRTFAPETIAKMSARMKGTSIRKGKKLSPEASLAKSMRQTGVRRRPRTEEEKANISAALKGRSISAEHRANLIAGSRRRHDREMAQKSGTVIDSTH